MKKLSIVFAIVACILSCSSPSHDLLITHVNVIDVVTGEVLPNRTVAIDGDEITAIYTKSIKHGKDTEVVDGTGKYLIPGLWDMHAHYNWFYESNDLLMIPNGVLGVRDPWGDPIQTQKLREMHLQGIYLGVDIFTAGSIIDGKPSMHGTSEVETPEEARAMVLCQVAQGADFVKPYSLLKKEVYLALMDEAQKQGIHASGHVPDAVHLHEALEVGHRIVDHIYGFESLYFTKEQMDTLIALSEEKKYAEAMAYYNKFRSSSLALSQLEQIKDKDIWFCPTYVTNFGVMKLFEDTMKADPRNEYIPIVLKHHRGRTYDSWADNPFYRGEALDSIAMIQSQKIMANREESIKMLIQADAKILAGTDYIIPYIYPGFSLQEELQFFVKFGMSPLKAIQTATINPAQAMKNDKTGEMKVGKKASLVLLNANPLDDIRHTQDIHAVILRGKHLDRSHLDGMLAEAKKLAKAKHLYDWFAPRFEEDGIETTIQTFLENKESIDAEYPIRWNMVLSAGRYLLEDGKIEEAFALVKLTNELYPNHFYSLAFSADIYSGGGNKVLAKEAYQKVLDLYPCYNVVERWSKELDDPVVFGKLKQLTTNEFYGEGYSCCRRFHIFFSQY